MLIWCSYSPIPLLFLMLIPRWVPIHMFVIKILFWNLWTFSSHWMQGKIHGRKNQTCRPHKFDGSNLHYSRRFKFIKSMMPQSIHKLDLVVRSNCCEFEVVVKCECTFFRRKVGVTSLEHIIDISNHVPWHDSDVLYPLH